MDKMKVKVCGMNNKQNITEVASLGTDLIGLIFFDKSPRGVKKGDVDSAFVKELKISKVGVFVNEALEVVLQIAKEYELNYLQLHGNESPEYCQRVKESGYKVWKAFSVGESIDTEQLKQYEGVVDLFLFDTKGKNYGGNGMKFNWEALNEYNLSKPFMLSGGLTLKDAENVSGLEFDKLWGVDLNSGFELEPGRKKPNEIEEFIKRIN
jgi:phosphoribosylanthranilate isomerase